MNVGLTFFVRKGEDSIWTNGAFQHCVFLWLLLRRAGRVANVYAINGGDGDAPHAGMMLNGLGIEFVRFDQVANKLDVLIEMGAQLSAAEVSRVRANGGRTVAMRFGNAYVIDGERSIHGKPAGSIFNGSAFDEIWTNAQHVNTCASYWETVYRCPVRVMPHVWEPLFVDKAIGEFPPDLTWGYRPREGRKARVSIFEPNLNIVKMAHLPMCVAENAYRRRPDLIGEVNVTNATALKTNETFLHFANALDIVRAKADDGHAVCCFEGRHNTPYWLATHTDVVVAHQWENALNFAYYDALYGEYPLVHNSDMLPANVGYHYRGFDARDGGNALLAALMSHDANRAEYGRNARAFLDTVRATNPVNVAAHENALAALFH